MTRLTFEYGARKVALRDSLAADVIAGATIRETWEPVTAIPPGETDYRRIIWDRSGVALACLLLRRELVAPDGVTLMTWDRDRRAWTAPPPDLAPIEAKRLDWATKRLSGRGGPGRRPGSGKVECRAVFLAKLRPVWRALRDAGHDEPSQALVAEWFDTSGEEHYNQKRVFQRQCRDAGFKNWGEVLDAIRDA